MADDAETPKSATDIEIENLKSELESIRATYESRLKEYADANKELWAELHKAPIAEQTDAEQAEPDRFDMEKAIDRFNAIYGLKEVKNV